MNNEAGSQYRKMQVFYNYDSTQYWYTRSEMGNLPTENDLRNFIRQYKDTDITDFSVTVNCSVSSTESKVMQSFSDKYLCEAENGMTVDFKNTFTRLLYSLRQQGVDPYKIWFEEIARCGMRPWMCFRMNDCHCFVSDYCSLVKSDLIEQHPEWWVCAGREPAGYFDKCLNYLLPEVRQYMLDYISEQLQRYEVFGIEMDFGREPYCFPNGCEEEGRRVMLDFFESVKNLTDEISRRKNGSIKINLICQADPVTAYQCGFDVAGAAEKQYIDAVIPAPRWATINLDIPLELWRRLIGKSIKLGAVQQRLVSGYCGSKDVDADLEMAYGQAAAFVSKGTDLIYLYNLFDRMTEAELSTRYYANSAPAQWKKIVKTIGHTEEIFKWDRRCPLTYDDFTKPYEPVLSKLPCGIKAGQCAALTITTGPILSGQEAYINIETAKPINAEFLHLYVHNKLAVPCKKSLEDPHIVRRNAYTFRIDTIAETAVVIEILSKIDFTIEYVEIYIKGL